MVNGQGNAILSTSFWRGITDSMGLALGQQSHQHLRDYASEAYRRDGGGWHPVYCPGDFGLQAWGSSSARLSAADMRRVVEAAGSQSRAAEILRVSQSTVSRAVRDWSPVRDCKVSPAFFLFMVMHGFPALPCAASRFESLVAEEATRSAREFGRDDLLPDIEQAAAQARRHTRAAIVLGLLVRGSDGLLHLGSGEVLADARGDYEYTLTGRVAAVCPRDASHGATLDRYCPKCKARVRRGAR